MSSRETVAFSEDAAYLAVVLKDGQVKVWDTAKRKLTQTFSPVTGKSPVSCLAWSKECSEGQQRRLLLALGTSGSVVVWSVVKGEKEAVLDSGQGGRVNSVCWNQQSASLYSTAGEHFVLEWKIDTWQQKTVTIYRKWKADKHEVTCLRCHENGKVLATAGRKIKLWNTEDHTLLQTFTGHATLVHHLQFVTESVIVSCAENDRVVDVWRQGQSTQAFLSFVCEEAVTSMDVHQEDDSVHMAAISEEGKLHLFSSSLTNEDAKPITALSTVQFVSSASEGSTPSHLPVLAAKLVMSQVCVAHSSLVRPTFESIDFNQSEPAVCLVREVKKGFLIHQDAPSTTDSTQHKGQRVQVLAPGPGMLPVPKGGEEDVPLMDQLQQAPPTPKKGGRKRNKANAESLSKMLAQAVHTEDWALMGAVLRVSNNKIVNSTVRKLPSSLVVPLLKQLVNLLYAKPYRALELSIWLRAILVCHTAYLTTIPQVVDGLNGLYQLLDSRVSTFGKLCHLQGKLDLMMSQSASGEGEKEEAKLNAPMFTITAGDNFVPSSPEHSDKEVEEDNVDERGMEEEEERGGEDDWSSAQSSDEELYDAPGDEDEKYLLLEESMDTHQEDLT